MSFSMSGLFLWSIIFTAVASPAFANIGWRFYIVFAALSGVMILICAFFFPEVSLNSIGILSIPQKLCEVLPNAD
jgi:hypothetical protein